MTITSWKDSAGYYAMRETEESIWLVTSEDEGCLSMYLKPSDNDEEWFYPEDMVFSLERKDLTDKGQEIYDELHDRLLKEYERYK